MFHKLAKHAELTLGMGKQTGYDIPSAIESGRMHELQLHAMIHRCAACSHPEECEKTLHNREAAPDFCRNRTIFSR